MKQAPIITVQKNKMFLAFLIAAILLSAGLMLLCNRPDGNTLPALADMVAAKAAAAAENTSYSIVIEESGPGYSLRFSGQANDGLIYGKIDAYELEVFAKQEKYFVKGSGLFEEWKEIGKAELEALSVVIRDPHDLLRKLLNANEILAEEGPIRSVEDVPCQTYFLEIPPPDLQLLTRFEHEATLDKLQIYLWFDQETSFLYRMAILMYVTVEGENIQINRIYNLSPEKKILPAGLPQVDGGVTAL